MNVDDIREPEHLRALIAAHGDTVAGLLDRVGTAGSIELKKIGGDFRFASGQIENLVDELFKALEGEEGP